MSVFTRKSRPPKHQEVWTDNKGNTVKVCDMDVNTLRNTHNFMIKRSREKQERYFKLKYDVDIRQCDANEQDIY